MRRLPLLALTLAACNRPDPTADTTSGTTTARPGTSTETGDAPTTDAPRIPDTSSTSSTSSTTGTSTTTSRPTTSAASTEGANTSETSDTTGATSVGLTYADVRQKSAHNSFQRDESLLDQIVYHRIRSLELDIHHSSSKSPTLAGEWYVYHVDVVDDASHCRRLSQCLTQISATAQAVPQHEVLTIWLDLKDGFLAGHQPVDLDARLEAAFGERLVTPGELLAACPGATTLRESVTSPGCGWPGLGALRGRVIVALTGGTLDDVDGPLATYVGADAGARAAFVAPGLAQASDLDTHPEAIFHNLEIADAALAGAVLQAGEISRVWVADDTLAWTDAEQAGAHHIATNKISVTTDPWASTAGPAGWPFRCIADCDPPTLEPGPLLRASVDSGDLWATADDAVLATWTPDGDVTLTALLTTPSSHVEPFAKACLIAREDLDAAAPYLAICRPADEHPLRVQLRVTAGAATEAIELGEQDGLTLETPAFARLVREGPCVRGLASIDGLTWLELGEHCFPNTLPHLGLVTSSHGAGELQLLYTGLTAAPGGEVSSGSLVVSPLGPAAGGVVDGL